MLYRVLEANDMRLPEEAIVCFQNTGKEDEATLAFVHECETRWNVKIHWIEYRNNEQGYAVVDYETASREGEPFEELADVYRQTITTSALLLGDATVQKSYSDKFEAALKNAKVNGNSKLL